jgi:hypothetical protein
MQAPNGIRRPRGVAVVASVLIGLGVVATVVAAMGAVTSSASGYAWMTIVLVLLPATFAAVAVAAGFGMLAGARWGWQLGLVAAAAVLAGGAWLVITALMEWSLPGSFAVLRLAPAAVAFLVGGSLAYGLISKRAYFADRSRE